VSAAESGNRLTLLNALEWLRKPGVVFAALGALALAACSAGADLGSSGLASSPPQTEAGDVQKARFNPFAEPDDAAAGRRQVIKNPTLAQVLQPGPLEEIAIGRADAPVTVIKYISPTCPFCRQWQQVVFPEFKRTYVDTGKVRLVLREFPIGHQSGAATIAIRCAAPGRRIALYTDLLNNQARWVSQEVRREPIFRIARTHGVTRQQFDACYANKQMIAGLKAVKDRGRTLGIIGTPNFFINNTLEKRVLRMKDLRAAIDPLLSAPRPGRTARVGDAG
jgi:protein-disulfide isomerase